MTSDDYKRLDDAGLEAAIRECARITAPEISDEEFAQIKADNSPRYQNTRVEMARAITAYLSAASVKVGEPVAWAYYHGGQMDDVDHPIVSRIRNKTLQEKPEWTECPLYLASHASSVRATRKALEPFAVACDHYSGEQDDEYCVDMDSVITLGHLRDARATFSANQSDVVQGETQPVSGAAAAPIETEDAEAVLGTSDSYPQSDGDCEDQGLCPTDVCIKFECQEWVDDVCVRPPLVLRGKYWVCPECHSSYGPDAKGQTPLPTSSPSQSVGTSECACGKFNDGKECPDRDGRPLCVDPSAPDQPDHLRFERFTIDGVEYIRCERVDPVLADLRRNLRHWKEECGKLHSRICLRNDVLTQALVQLQITRARIPRGKDQETISRVINQIKEVSK